MLPLPSSFLKLLLLLLPKQASPSQALRLHAFARSHGLFQTHALLGHSRAHGRSPCTWNETAFCSLVHGFFRSGDLRAALSVYQRAREQSIKVGPRECVILLQCCGQLNDLERGCEIHAEIVREGWLGRGTESAYGIVHLERGYGATERRAEQAMREDAPSCGLQRGCEMAREGDGQKSDLEMQDWRKSVSERRCEEEDHGYGVESEGICEKMRGDATAEVGLMYEVERVCKCDPFLACSLVDMYSKCGALTRAREVFSMLPKRNTATWNALISGYVRNGDPEAALGFLDKMQIEGIPPDSVTFTLVLKGCSAARVIDKGTEIHADIHKRALLENNPFVGTALIDMYCKCGMLVDARSVLDAHSCRNVVAYTALISGYVENEWAEEALECYEAMKRGNVAPNSATYACCLRACGMVDGGIEKGLLIDAEITAQGLYEKDISVGNAWVDMYAKYGMLEKAPFAVLDKIPIPNSVTWNSLSAGYLRGGQHQEALHCLDWMQTQGSMPDAISFTCCLRACGPLNSIEKGTQIHAQVAGNGLLENKVSVGNALVDMYAKCGELVEAKEVLDSLPFRDVSTWNSVITGYAQHDDAEGVLKCYEEMKLDGVNPNAITYASGLKACVLLGAAGRGNGMHSEVIRRGLFVEDMVMGSTLVDMYAKCGMLAEAQKVFDMLPIRDVVAWTCVIAGYEGHDCGEEALDCFEQMRLEGLSPNAFTYASGLRACGRIGAMGKGEEIHGEVDRKGLLGTDKIVASAVVGMYAKCGSLAQAEAALHLLPPSNTIITWNALITGYAQVGELRCVLDLVQRMRMEGNEPDGVTFLNVVNACSHAGLVNHGKLCFKAMADDYRIAPTLSHFTCLIDLLGRAGQLEEALAMASESPFHADIAMWLAILGACRKWGNSELARHAFEHALLCHGYQASAYICMLNVIADAG